MSAHRCARQSAHGVTLGLAQGAALGLAQGSAPGLPRSALGVAHGVQFLRPPSAATRSAAGNTGFLFMGWDLVMARLAAAAVAMTALALTGCAHADYAERPIPRIAADGIGKPVSRLREVFGQPRKVESTPYQLVYVWYLEEIPAGAPAGFHGCEMEVTVDSMSDHVLGYSLSDIGWGKCSEIQRKVAIAER